jgi:hypothetical protein
MKNCSKNCHSNRAHWSFENNPVKFLLENKNFNLFFSDTNTVKLCCNKHAWDRPNYFWLKLEFIITELNNVGIDAQSFPIFLGGGGGGDLGLWENLGGGPLFSFSLHFYDPTFCSLLTHTMQRGTILVIGFMSTKRLRTHWGRGLPSCVFKYWP